MLSPLIRVIPPGRLLAAFFAILFLSACRQTPESFSNYICIPKEGWRYDDTLRFTPEVAPDLTGEFRLGLRHNGEYPYRNLWLEVSSPVQGDSTALRRDTLAIDLADKYGRWLGTGVGPLRQLEVVIAPKFTVDSGRTIFVRHIMRCDTLPHIEQVGIFIEQTYHDLR